MAKKIKKNLFLKAIIVVSLFTISSCTNNNRNVICSSMQLSQQDSIQIITKLMSNEGFIIELPRCEEDTPFVIAKNGYIKNTYNIKYEEHLIVLKSLVDILYIRGVSKENPIKVFPIYRIGPKILIEITDFSFQKDSVFIQMTLCGNGTFFNYSFKKNSNNNWEANLLQKGNT